MYKALTIILRILGVIIVTIPASTVMIVSTLLLAVFAIIALFLGAVVEFCGRSILRVIRPY